MTFVDSNIPMYLIGAAHRHKTEAQILLERLIAKGERLVSDAEVPQEILYRYVAIDRREAIDPAIKLTLEIVDQIFPVQKADVLRAGEIVLSRASLSARDAVHVAITERHGLEVILSFDSGFDHWPGLSRPIQPLPANVAADAAGIPFTNCLHLRAICPVTSLGRK